MRVGQKRKKMISIPFKEMGVDTFLLFSESSYWKTFSLLTYISFFKPQCLIEMLVKTQFEDLGFLRARFHYFAVISRDFFACKIWSILVSSSTGSSSLGLELEPWIDIGKNCYSIDCQ